MKQLLRWLTGSQQAKRPESEVRRRSQLVLGNEHSEEDSHTRQTGSDPSRTIAGEGFDPYDAGGLEPVGTPDKD